MTTHRFFFNPEMPTFIGAVTSRRKVTKGVICLRVERQQDGGEQWQVLFVKTLTSSLLARLVLIGTTISVEGVQSGANAVHEGGISTWKIIKCSAEAGFRSIERLVHACMNGDVSIEVGAAALQCDVSRLEAIIDLIQRGKSVKSEFLRLNRRLLGLEQEIRYRKRSPKIHFEKRDALASVLKDLGAFKKDIKFVPLVDENSPLLFDPVNRKNDEHLAGFNEQKKKPQIRWMLEILKMASFDFAVDVGCGKGDLALNVAATFPSVQVIAVDTNQTSLDQGRERALRKGIENVVFRLRSAEDLLNENFTEGRPIFLGLHACGGLTDLVVELCRHNEAQMICVPCCFHRHADIRNRFRYTDENWFLDPTVAKHLISLSTITDIPEFSRSAMQAINSIRLKSISVPCQLLEFDPKFSPKNQVIAVLFPSADSS